MNKIYGYDGNIYETGVGNISNPGLRIYGGNISTSTGKVVVNGVEVTDIESWNKALDTFTNLEQKIKEKEKEIERLKAREQECIDRYLAESKYRSEMEDKYILAKYAIDELEKLFEKEIKEGRPKDHLWLMGYYDASKNYLKRLKELKEGEQNENLG